MLAGCLSKGVVSGTGPVSYAFKYVMMVLGAFAVGDFLNFGIGLAISFTVIIPFGLLVLDMTTLLYDVP